MFSRVITYTGAERIGDGVTYLRDHVVPELHQQRGFAGITVSVDRTNKVLGVLSLWQTAADREASESGMEKARAEALRLVGGTLTVEHFEELYVELVKPPTPGSALLIRRLRMDPAGIEENLAYFTQEVVPQLKASPGLLAIRNMVNRTNGQGLVGTSWADGPAMEAAAKAADARRQAAGDRGITFGDQSRREIVLIDLVKT